MPLTKDTPPESISDKIAALSYSKEIKQGCCFGYALLSEAAFLLDELDIFEQRIKRIAQTDVATFKKMSQDSQRGVLSKELIPFFNECTAFFDPIVLYQLTSSYPQILGVHSNQRTVRDVQWLLPNTLQNQLFRIPTFSGGYGLDDLETYFKLIKEKLNENNISVSLILECGDHAIQLCYNHITQEWSMSDVLLSEIKKFTSHEALAFAVFDSFYNGEEDPATLSSEDTNTIFSTTVTVHQSKKESLIQAFQQLNQEMEWQSLHQVTSETAALVDSTGNSWLTLAIHTGDTNLVKHLLSRPETNVNQQSKQGSFPLYLAAHFGDTEIVRLLLNHPETDVSLSITNGSTAFHIACQNGFTNIVTLFLQHRNIRDLINQRNDDDYTALHTALYEKQYNIVYLLLNYAEYLNPNIVDESHMSPLHLICTLGNLPLLTEFCKCPDINFEIEDNRKQTPFMVACDNQKIKVARWLVTHYGVNVNAQDSEGNTALISAVTSKNKDVLDFLLSINSLDLDIADMNDDTAFIIACTQNDLEVICKLLQRGCNIIKKNVDNVTGIDILVQQSAWNTLWQLSPFLNRLWYKLYPYLSTSTQVRLNQFFLQANQPFQSTQQPQESPDQGKKRTAENNDCLNLHLKRGNFTF